MRPRIFQFIAAGLLGVLALVVVLQSTFHTLRPVPPSHPRPPLPGHPRLILWAWETPEDLRALATGGTAPSVGVAFLAREIFLADTPTVRPRLQPLRLSPGTWLMADVRLEPTSAFRASPALVSQTAQAIAAAAALPNVRALQVDFDATASQRDFYAAVLRELRRDLPAHFPLSITALVSWCGPHSWLRALPIDEAVPMFFRMGGSPALRAITPRSESVLAEPLCSTSVGIATDELWPAIPPNQTVYLFRPGPWTPRDLALLHQFGYQGLARAANPAPPQSAP